VGFVEAKAGDTGGCLLVLACASPPPTIGGAFSVAADARQQAPWCRYPLIAEFVGVQVSAFQKMKCLSLVAADDFADCSSAPDWAIEGVVRQMHS
jgi:hypothetical protein